MEVEIYPLKNELKKAKCPKCNCTELETVLTYDVDDDEDTPPDMCYRCTQCHYETHPHQFY